MIRYPENAGNRCGVIEHEFGAWFFISANGLTYISIVINIILPFFWRL